MPPHRSVLSSEDTAQVISYIRSAWGNPATEIVTTEMIEDALARSSERSTKYIANELPPADVNLPGEQPAWASGEPAEGEAAEGGAAVGEEESTE